MAYGNIGHVDDMQGWINTDSTSPDGYLQHAITRPAQIIGGCCGSTPGHIRTLNQHWKTPRQGSPSSHGPAK